MVTLNPSTFAAVAEKAAHDAANHPRWLTAIGRAIVELDSNPYVERTDHGLLIGSPSGECYAANGVCQCTAYTGILNGKRVHAGGLPCYHRAMARLVRLCDEKEAAAQLEGAAIADAQRAGLVTMPEGDLLDTSGMRVARKIAAERATRQLNELFV